MGYRGAKLRRWFDDSDGIADACREMADALGDFQTRTTIQNTPIDSGWLRAEIRQKITVVYPGVSGSKVYATGSETHVEYACVFGPSTPVVTSNGLKRIADVRAGDLVLTQAGDYQPVLAAASFPAMEKPDLIEIAVPWRRGAEHRLTLTLDHKVLVARGGRNLWVEAGDLRGGDRMYARQKLAHNKGTGKVKVCEWCDRRHRGQGRRYCTQRCRDDAWAAGANPHLGARRSDATREKLRAASTARGAGIRMNRTLAQRGNITSCERAVEGWLIERGVAYERQVEIGGHVVDFFLPVQREVIEADGAYWHQSQERDVERDRELLEVLPGVEITHMHFYDKRFSPDLDPEPLPGVRYVACNPGPKSYIDPAQFEARPVRIVGQHVYGKARAQKHGAWSARLYDLSVQGVHSFLASGLVVSNSFVEHGTGLWGPKHARYEIKPRNPNGWLRWIDPVTGNPVFAKRVMHPGSPGSHMFALGVALTEHEFERLVDPAVRKCMARLERSIHRHRVVNRRRI